MKWEVVVLNTCFISASWIGITEAMMASSSSTPPFGQQSVHDVVTVGEGSLTDIYTSKAMALKPGATPGFYNPKRRIGRDFVVLSRALWLANEARKHHHAKKKKVQTENENKNDLRPARLLDATCATGIQGLRAYITNLLSLAHAILSENNQSCENCAIPDLNVILNDLDADALELARKNVASIEIDTHDKEANVEITQRVAQSIMHERTFEISVLDPFGSCQPFLDAAFARAPSNGMIEICATDVGVLYGTRPTMAKRHYGAHISTNRPPCYRERGVRMMLAAIAQAAGRNDRGIAPVYSISAEHFCLLSVKVRRGAKAADQTAEQVQSIKICQACGATSTSEGTPSCGCEPSEQGIGIAAIQEGPIWIGLLHDEGAIQEISSIASLDVANGLISKDMKKLLETLQAGQGKT